MSNSLNMHKLMANKTDSDSIELNSSINQNLCLEIILFSIIGVYDLFALLSSAIKLIRFLGKKKEIYLHKTEVTVL